MHYKQNKLRLFLINSLTSSTLTIVNDQEYQFFPVPNKGFDRSVVQIRS